MNRFQVGDRVRCIESSNNVIEGTEGTVVMEDISPRGESCIEWDIKIYEGHDCEGHCTHGYGRYIFATYIELVGNHQRDIQLELFE